MPKGKFCPVCRTATQHYKAGEYRCSGCKRTMAEAASYRRASIVGTATATTASAPAATPAPAASSTPSGLPECWQVVEAVLAVSADVRTPVLLYGPPATGKTTAAQTINVDPASVAAVTMTDGTTEAELRGHFMPQGAEWQFHYGPAIAAWKRGCRFVINELHNAPMEVMSFLHVLLDDPEVAKAELPNNETLTPVDSFRVIATMNGDPLDLPDEALADRFAIRINVDVPHPAVYLRLQDHYRKAARESCEIAEQSRRCTPRQWIGVDDLTRAGVEEKIAFRAVFGDRATDLLDAIKLAR